MKDAQETLNDMTHRNHGPMIRRTLIREHYEHGEHYRLGSRSAEIVRAYAGDWRVYYYEKGRMLTLNYYALRDNSRPYRCAVRLARLFVQTGQVS